MRLPARSRPSPTFKEDQWVRQGNKGGYRRSGCGDDLGDAPKPLFRPTTAPATSATGMGSRASHSPDPHRPHARHRPCRHPPPRPAPPGRGSPRRRRRLPALRHLVGHAPLHHLRLGPAWRPSTQKRGRTPHPPRTPGRGGAEPGSRPDSRRNRRQATTGRRSWMTCSHHQNDSRRSGRPDTARAWRAAPPRASTTPPSPLAGHPGWPRTGRRHQPGPGLMLAPVGTNPPLQVTGQVRAGFPECRLRTRLVAADPCRNAREGGAVAPPPSAAAAYAVVVSTS